MIDHIKILRNLITEMYDWHFEHDEDGHHKSCEGAITITKSFPNYFEDNEKIHYHIEVYSYIFCNDGRRFEAEGDSEYDVIMKAVKYFGNIFNELKSEAEKQ